MKKYKVYISGVPFHTTLAKDVLSLSSCLEIVLDVNDADVVYHIFGPDMNMENLRFWLSRKKHIIHWIGSDTEFYCINSSLFDRFVKFVKKTILESTFFFKRLAYISSAPWIGEIVQKNSKIPVEYVLISSISENRIKRYSMDRDIDFLTYIPQGREETYSLPSILQAARENSENNFFVVNPWIKSLDEMNWDLSGLENVTVLPNLSHDEMIRLICRTRCFLRLKASGDAYALTVLEALYCGCNVLWNVPDSGLVGVTYLEKAEDLAHFLADGGKQKLLSLGNIYRVIDDIEVNFSEREWINGIEKTLHKLFNTTILE